MQQSPLVSPCISAVTPAVSPWISRCISTDAASPLPPALEGDTPAAASARDDSALYARLVALNSRWFDFDGCTWFGSEAHGGSARASIYAASGGCPFVYTLECNYDSGVKPNALPPRHGTKGSSSDRALTARLRYAAEDRAPHS